MYFTEFDSYKKAVDGAQSFVIDVERVDGTVINSSSIPYVAWDSVAADIAEFCSTKSVLSIWRRDVGTSGGTVVLVPYEQMKTINLRLFK